MLFIASPTVLTLPFWSVFFASIERLLVADPRNRISALDFNADNCQWLVQFSGTLVTGRKAKQSAVVNNLSQLPDFPTHIYSVELATVPIVLTLSSLQSLLSTQIFLFSSTLAHWVIVITIPVSFVGHNFLPSSNHNLRYNLAYWDGSRSILVVYS